MVVKKDDNMDFEQMYIKAYCDKGKPEGVYSMNAYCSNIEEMVTIDNIPDLMRLYYDKPITTEQNEFITVVLDKIVLEQPELAAINIIKNVNILKQENALDCIFYILLIFINWNEEISDYFLDALVQSDKADASFFIKELEHQVNKYNDDEYRQFLEVYYERMGLLEN